MTANRVGRWKPWERTREESYDFLVARPLWAMASTAKPTNMPAMIDSTGKPGIAGATSGTVDEEAELVLTLD